jgi:hypothetical protein
MGIECNRLFSIDKMQTTIVLLLRYEGYEIVANYR